MMGGTETLVEDDRELLGRFVESRDEAAFAALVSRHGRMALGVCRRILGNSSEADDAFQAAFLVLIDRAEELHRGRGGVRSLGGWLHRVAANAALQLRRESKSRQRREAVFAKARADQSGDPLMREALPILDVELQRLPERYRAPLVLCYFQDHSQQKAAETLGISYATLRRRLDQGRELLRARLARRGCSIAPALLASVLWDSAAWADQLAPDTSEALGSPLIHAASPGPLKLSQRLLRMMRNQAIRRSAGLLVVLLVLLGSTGLVGRNGFAAAGPQARKGETARAVGESKAEKVARGEGLPKRQGGTKKAPTAHRADRPSAKAVAPTPKAPAPEAPAIEESPELDREILNALKQGPVAAPGAPSTEFQGAISINGPTRRFANQQEFEKAMREMPDLAGAAPGKPADAAPAPARAHADPADEAKVEREVRTALKKSASARKRRAARVVMPQNGGMAGFGFEGGFGMGGAGGQPGMPGFGGAGGAGGMPGMPGFGGAGGAGGMPGFGGAGGVGGMPGFGGAGGMGGFGGGAGGAGGMPGMGGAGGMGGFGGGAGGAGGMPGMGGAGGMGGFGGGAGGAGGMPGMGGAGGMGGFGGGAGGAGGMPGMGGAGGMGGFGGGAGGAGGMPGMGGAGGMGGFGGMGGGGGGLGGKPFRGKPGPGF